MVSALRNETVLIWDVATRKIERIQGVHSPHVSSAAFSSDGTRLVSSSLSTASVWNVDKMEQEKDTLVSCMLSHSHLMTRVVSGSGDGTVRV